MSEIRPGAGILPGEAVSADAINRLITEYAELEAIVRDLAGRDPIVNLHPDWDEYVCIDCVDEDADAPPAESAQRVQHTEGCLTRRARAWVMKRSLAVPLVIPDDAPHDGWIGPPLPSPEG